MNYSDGFNQSMYDGDIDINITNTNQNVNDKTNKNYNNIIYQSGTMIVNTNYSVLENPSERVFY